MNNDLNHGEKKKSGLLRTSIRIVLLMFFGGCIGIAVGKLLKYGGSDVLGDAAGCTMTWIQQEGHWIIPALGIIMTALSILFLCWGKRLIRTAETEKDEERVDLLDERIDYVENLNLTVINISYVLLMVLFGVLGSMSTFSIADCVSFLISMFSYSLCFCMLIFQMKKRDSRKEGDPMQFNFKKVWLKSCDEAEKEKAYQAAFYTQRFMCGGICLLFVLTLVITLYWNKEPFAVIMVGAVWLMQVAGSGIYGILADKSKLK